MFVSPFIFPLHFDLTWVYLLIVQKASKVDMKGRKEMWDLRRKKNDWARVGVIIIIITIIIFFGHTCSIWKFSAQGLNPKCSCNPSCSCSNACTFNPLPHSNPTWASTRTVAAAVSILNPLCWSGNSQGQYYWWKWTYRSEVQLMTSIGMISG